MTSTKEASVMEPHQTERIADGPRQAIRATSVAHGFGELEVLDRIDLDVAEGEVVGLVGPSGCGKSTFLELVSGLARAAWADRSRSRAPASPARASRAAPTCPSATCSCPGSRPSTTPRSRRATGAQSKRASREEALPLFSRFGLAEFADADAGRALGRHAPARRLPADAPRGQAGSPARRAVRRARRDHPRRDAGVAGGRAPRRAAHRPARDARRRGGALSVRPRGRAFGPPGANRRRAAAQGAASARPRGRRHRPRLRRRFATRRCARSGSTRDEEVRSCRSRSSSSLLAIWEVLAQTGTLADILGIRESVSDAIVPAPTDVASVAMGRPRAARRATAGHASGDAGRPSRSPSPWARASRSRSTCRRRSGGPSTPLLVASQTIPIVAIAAVLVIWLGFGIGPKLAVVALICFFPITVNMLDGLRSVDPSGGAHDADARRRAAAMILRRLELPCVAAPVLLGRQDRRGDRADRRGARRVRRGQRGPRAT